jgi:hypothetical protein
VVVLQIFLVFDTRQLEAVEIALLHHLKLEEWLDNKAVLFMV